MGGSWGVLWVDACVGMWLLLLFIYKCFRKHQQRLTRHCLCTWARLLISRGNWDTHTHTHTQCWDLNTISSSDNSPYDIEISFIVFQRIQYGKIVKKNELKLSLMMKITKICCKFVLIMSPRVKRKTFYIFSFISLLLLEHTNTKQHKYKCMILLSSHKKHKMYVHKIKITFNILHLICIKIALKKIMIIYFLLLFHFHFPMMFNECRRPSHRRIHQSLS